VRGKMENKNFEGAGRRGPNGEGTAMEIWFASCNFKAFIWTKYNRGCMLHPRFDPVQGNLILCSSPLGKITVFTSMHS